MEVVSIIQTARTPKTQELAAEESPERCLSSESSERSSEISYESSGRSLETPYETSEEITSSESSEE